MIVLPILLASFIFLQGNSWTFFTTNSFRSSTNSLSSSSKKTSAVLASSFYSSSSFSFTLHAKKKASKFISDDLLANLDYGESGENENKKDKSASNTVVVDKPNASKTAKFGISEGLLQSILDDDEDDEDVKAESKGKKPKKDKKKDKKLSEDTDDSNDIESKEIIVSKETSAAGLALQEDDGPETHAAEETLTIEQRVRRDKPSSRVRFAESTQPGYVMMGLENVGMIYGDDVVLKDATFSVTTGERVGLVGPNGGGKSTQLKILAGELEATTGDVVKSSSNLRVAFLRQEFTDGLVLTNTLKEELLASFEEENRILKEIQELEERVASATDDAAMMDQILDDLAKKQDEANARGVYALESRAEKIMDATGFSSDDGAALVSSFSGGWKMRIGLAKILLTDPNILLLDEPTNHLDLDSVMWLEKFLPKQNIPMVIVSHDREFLDQVCNKIVDMEDGATVTYNNCNYSKFLERRRDRLNEWKEKFDKQVRFIRDEERFLKRAKSDESITSQTKSREMSLEKLKNGEGLIPQPPKDKKFRFRFPDPPRCGDKILEVSKLTHGFGDGKYKVLFEDVDYEIERGDRIGFIGPNGSGKSTMMKIIMGLIEPQKGYTEICSPSVVSNYYAQNQADALDLDKTVLECVQENAPTDVSFTDVRSLLGQFMFKGDDVYKKIRVLSGGEKARVALCRMMLTPANLLLLDEPTNHLDITSKEVLEDALLAYTGSVLIISHDRYFMSQVVNTIFSFHDKTVERFDCDYHDYMLQYSNDENLEKKITSRYVAGDKYQITNSKEAAVEDNSTKKKKNFGGSGVTGGNLFKGIKNAKRFSN